MSGGRILGRVAAPQQSTASSPRSGIDVGFSPRSVSPLQLQQQPSSTLSCPICQEECITLLQLNRHIDDAHGEIAETQKETVKSWFRRRLVKAKALPPVAAIRREVAASTAASTDFERNGGTVEGASGIDAAMETDAMVDRSHWQRNEGSGIVCADVACGKVLGGRNGKVNCRKCGRLYCSQHTMYQMRLARNAEWDPVYGTWCRVCEECYVLRPGYLDVDGVRRDRTKQFTESRQSHLNHYHLEVNRLERRLQKLLRILRDDVSDNQSGGIWSSLFSSSTNRKERALQEQTVVAWQDDMSVAVCPYCNRKFGFSLRKHHCRTCGKVICSDIETNCSADIAIDVPGSDQGTLSTVDVRMCKECQRTLLSRRDEKAATAPMTLSRIVKSYNNLNVYKNGINSILPNFRSLLFILRESQSNLDRTQIEEASRIRKRLIDLFAQYESAAKKIALLPVSSDTERIIQQNIIHASSLYLQTNMLPLQSLPRLLRHRQNDASSHSPSSSISSEVIINGEYRPSHGLTDEEEAQEKEKLIVLEEQKFLVANMLSEATSRRRFAEVQTLESSVKDLDAEIDRVRMRLGEL